MFEKTLTDVVKGIRASKRDTAKYISQCISEIKKEIASSDMHVKANALNKLTFLQMMGYSMSWASFATIEVMSSPRFYHKRIGYLAAVRVFFLDLFWRVWFCDYGWCTERPVAVVIQELLIAFLQYTFLAPHLVDRARGLRRTRRLSF